MAWNVWNNKIFYNQDVLGERCGRNDKEAEFEPISSH